MPMRPVTSPMDMPRPSIRPSWLCVHSRRPAQNHPAGNPHMVRPECMGWACWPRLSSSVLLAVGVTPPLQPACCCGWFPKLTGVGGHSFIPLARAFGGVPPPHPIKFKLDSNMAAQFKFPDSHVTPCPHRQNSTYKSSNPWPTGPFFHAPRTLRPWHHASTLQGGATQYFCSAWV